MLISAAGTEVAGRSAEGLPRWVAVCSVGEWQHLAVARCVAEPLHWVSVNSHRERALDMPRLAALIARS